MIFENKTPGFQKNIDKEKFVDDLNDAVATGNILDLSFFKKS